MYGKAISGIIGAAGTANAGDINAREMRLQAATSEQQTFADEETQRRLERQFRGNAAASLAENGLTPTGSSGMMVDQNAAEAELDALNTRYHGMLRARTMLQQAKDTKHRAYMQAGQQLLNSVGDAYG